MNVLYRLAILGLVLSGCGDSVNLLNPSEVLGNRTPLSCPRADVIEQASSYVDFAPNRTGDVNAIRYSVRFVDLKGECRLDEEGKLELDLFMLFLAQSGVALETDTVTSAPWFLVVLHRKDNKLAVAARKQFTQAIEIKRDGDVVPIREQFSITVPGVNEATMAEYIIVGGFMLDDSQWDFNEANAFYFR